jgi:6-methylsalicylate decarboxylase
MLVDQPGEVGDPVIVDLHQHVWPEPFLIAMRSRSEAPRLRNWTLELPGERDYEIDPDQHDVARRVQESGSDGFDLVLNSLSSPLGIESLPCSQAHPLLEAYHDGALELPPPYGAWAAACLTKVDPDALERELKRGFVGLQLPATALLDEAGYDHVAPLLSVLAEAARPLFIHPGPAGTSPTARPAWWPAVVSYVQQMHAAWFAFRAVGRRHHPDLDVCFAMLAGLAPLHGERFAARAGERTVTDRNIFLEISSYGTKAIDATVRVLGIDGLVNGSDRPYARPVSPDLGDAALHALRTANPLRLLHRAKEGCHELASAAGAQLAHR